MTADPDDTNAQPTNAQTLRAHEANAELFIERTSTSRVPLVDLLLGVIRVTLYVRERQ